jgi:hypothetical protein
MHTPGLGWYFLFGCCVVGMTTLGCTSGEQQQASSEQVEQQAEQEKSAAGVEAESTEAVPVATAIPPLEPTDYYDVTDPDLNCEDANRFSVRTVERLGYEVTSFTPAAEDTEGRIEAKQIGRWGGEEEVSVTISCGPKGTLMKPRSNVLPCDQANMIMRQALRSSGFTITSDTPATLASAGRIAGEKEGAKPTSVAITCHVDRNIVEMEISQDSPLVDSVDFYKALSDFQLGFYTAFNKVEGRIARNPADQGRLYVSVRPMNLVDTQIVFGAKDLGVLPLKVNIANPTALTYVLETERIVLLEEASGKRIKPLSAEEASLPTPPLTDRQIGPGASIQGYLYYPSGTYTGARGSMAEQQSQEREGFSVDFKPW